MCIRTPAQPPQLDREHTDDRAHSPIPAVSIAHPRAVNPRQASAATIVRVTTAAGRRRTVFDDTAAQRFRATGCAAAATSARAVTASSSIREVGER